MIAGAQAMLQLRSVYTNGQWGEFTKYRIAKETKRLHPHRRFIDQVEWALATRFQGDEDMYVKEKERGSSLDPSAELGAHLTTKIGFDLTKPMGEAGKHFEKVEYPPVDVGRFVVN